MSFLGCNNRTISRQTIIQIRQNSRSNPGCATPPCHAHNPLFRRSQNRINLNEYFDVICICLNKTALCDIRWSYASIFIAVVLRCSISSSVSPLFCSSCQDKTVGQVACNTSSWNFELESNVWRFIPFTLGSQLSSPLTSSMHEDTSLLFIARNWSKF